MLLDSFHADLRCPDERIEVAGMSSSGVERIREQKRALRKRISDALTNLDRRAERSQSLCNALIAHPAWQNASTVAIFASMQSEPDVELLWPHADAKRLCYPVITPEGLEFVAVDSADRLQPGRWGIREPIRETQSLVPANQLDLVVVPGAAFTLTGERLGRGGGFYDRVLVSTGFRAFKAGVCFDAQIVPALPSESHDQRVDCVVTESGVRL